MNLSCQEFVKKIFPNEVILSSLQKKVHFCTFLSVKRYSRTSSTDALYPLDIIETDKRIYFDRKDTYGSLRFFVIDKKDIAKTETEMKDGQKLKKITMIPKRMYEFQIYHFTNINNAPQDAVSRIFYKIRRFIDLKFGFIAAKYTAKIIY